MVGLVISDNFILTGRWEIDEKGTPNATGILEIPLNEPISSLLHNESELNMVLSSAIRQARELNAFEGEKVAIALPDSFVQHSIIPIEIDLSKEDHVHYIDWVENSMGYPVNQAFNIFGQIYFPAEKNIHICKVPRALVRTVKLSINEMGGINHWMGPASSLYLDGSGMSESAVINRQGNKYSFLKVQNNVFGMGTITFTSGIPKVSFTTDETEEITLAALGLEESDLDDIPVFCPQRLGRQAKSVWEKSDFRLSIPLENILIEGTNQKKLPYYEANILTQLMGNIALEHSFNFFHDPGLTDFFYTQVIPEEEPEENIETLEVVELNDDKVSLEEEIQVDSKSTSITGYAIAILLIVGGFIGFNYLKLQDQLNDAFFGVNEGFTIKRSGVNDSTSAFQLAPKLPPIDLIKESRAISTSIINLFTETDINRYNALTITKSFLSLEYLSGVNPNIENILKIEPTSFSVEATGRDSTIFLWYYSFELPVIQEVTSSGKTSKLDLMVQLDTSLTDYNLKYFEQVYTKNQIYGPLLIWVRGKADILQASALISNADDSILLRKFVLFNKSDKPNPRAGFYVSILED